MFLYLIHLIYYLSLNNAAIIKRGYHYFDHFYYRDIYRDYIEQNYNKKCSLEEGPNCYFVSIKDEDYIKNDIIDFNLDFTKKSNQSLDYIYQYLKKISNSLSGKENESIEELEDEEVLSFDAPYSMTLTLTFESFDPQTEKVDIYSPGTIDTPFDLGRITLTIIGKLRLTQKDAKIFESDIISKEDKPKSTYAYVESKEVIIKFNSKSSISYLYIKKNKYNFDNKIFFLYGYKNEKKYTISKMENVPSDHWLRVSGDGKKYDSIVLIRGFDYDNININSYIENVKEMSVSSIKYSNTLSAKLSDIINKVIKGDTSSYTKTNKDGVEVIEVHIDSEDIIDLTEEESEFEIPQELLMDNNEQKSKDLNEDKKDNKLNEDL